MGGRVQVSKMSSMDIVYGIEIVEMRNWIGLWRFVLVHGVWVETGARDWEVVGVRFAECWLIDDHGSCESR